MTHPSPRTQLTGPLPDELGELKHLTRLWLYENPELDGPLPASMAAGCPQLRMVDMRHTRLTVPPEMREAQGRRAAAAAGGAGGFPLEIVE